MSFFSFKLGKRRDRRSNRPEQRVLWLGGISETLSQAGFPGVRELFWGALFGATMAVCAALIVAVSFGQSHHATGQALTEPIVARVKFAWVDKVATADRKKKPPPTSPMSSRPTPRSSMKSANASRRSSIQPRASRVSLTPMPRPRSNCS